MRHPINLSALEYLLGKHTKNDVDILDVRDRSPRTTTLQIFLNSMSPVQCARGARTLPIDAKKSIGTCQKRFEAKQTVEGENGGGKKKMSHRCAQNHIDYLSRIQRNALKIPMNTVNWVFLLPDE